METLHVCKRCRLQGADPDNKLPCFQDLVCQPDNAAPDANHHHTQEALTPQM
jgi:hypothetical protein